MACLGTAIRSYPEFKNVYPGILVDMPGYMFYILYYLHFYIAAHHR